MTGQDCQVGIISEDWAKMSLAVRLTETIYEASIPARIGNKLQEWKEKTCFLNVVFTISKRVINGLHFFENGKIYVLSLITHIFVYIALGIDTIFQCFFSAEILKQIKYKLGPSCAKLRTSLV